MLFRFRAVGFHRGVVEVRSGVLGLTKAFGTGAANIVKATHHVVKRFLSGNLRRTAGGDDGPATSAGEVLPDTLDRVLAKVEAVTVDAASDELLAAELGRGEGIDREDVAGLLRLRGSSRDDDAPALARGPIAATDLLKPLTPNLRLVIRDVTHASRRVTQKPEAADDYLSGLVDWLFADKHSITQIIHHSEVWRHEFQTFVAKQDEAVGVVTNVRAAKHRHESAAKPRGRFVLNFDAFLQVALVIVADREGRGVRQHATRFLTDLDEEAALQVAMLADAADEALQFTRKLDNETIDTAEMQTFIERFISSLKILFVDGQVLTLPGFTSHMVKLLEKPRAFQPGPSLPLRKLGGPAAVTDAIVKRCLGRMTRYTHLAEAVIRAEFPDFEVVAAFRVFNLEAAASGGGLIERPRVLTASQEEDLQRLCHFFHQDFHSVEAAYLAHRPVAMVHKESTQCGNGTAWQHAIAALSRQGPKNLEKQPARGLIYIIMRFLCIAVSTAKVEQSFAVLKRTFGEQGLNAADEVEEQMARTILSIIPDEDALLARAQAAPPAKKNAKPPSAITAMCLCCSGVIQNSSLPGTPRGLLHVQQGQVPAAAFRPRHPTEGQGRR